MTSAAEVRLKVNMGESLSRKSGGMPQTIASRGPGSAAVGSSPRNGLFYACRSLGGSPFHRLERGGCGRHEQGGGGDPQGGGEGALFGYGQPNPDAVIVNRVFETA